MLRSLGTVVIAISSIICATASNAQNAFITNTNDGYNRMAHDVPGHAVAVLESGRSLAGSMSISAVQASGKDR